MSLPDHESLEAIGQQVREQVVALEPTEWLPSPQAISVEPLSEGPYHSNFLLCGGPHTYVARVNRESQRGLSQMEQLAREFAVLGDLKTTGVAPEPIAFIGSVELPFIVESLVPGEPVNYAADPESCAEAIAIAHGCEPRACSRLIEPRSPMTALLDDGREWLEKVSRSNGRSESAQLLRRVSDTLARRPSFDGEEVLIHTDLTQNNMMIDSRRCVIVDWEGASIGPRAWDIAYFLSPTTLFLANPRAVIDAQSRVRFLERYADVAEVDAKTLGEEADCLSPFVAFKALSWCLANADREHGDAYLRDCLKTLTSADFVESIFRQMAVLA